MKGKVFPVLIHWKTLTHFLEVDSKTDGQIYEVSNYTLSPSNKTHLGAHRYFFGGWLGYVGFISTLWTSVVPQIVRKCSFFPSLEWLLFCCILKMQQIFKFQRFKDLWELPRTDSISESGYSYIPLLKPLKFREYIWSWQAFFNTRPYNKYCRLVGHVVSVTLHISVIVAQNNHRWYISVLCFNKTLYTEAIGPDLLMD